ncbi:MAG: hypothetical protein JXR46_13835 [Calditrichaceae bacterium]|nr:hypothetical protein [Calditrichaceae bacterium]MBN2710117.1 hypothetical protein [Calditrichaceae bacterium]RQV93435.1 MAG: hypothetical protein EH224_12520 [Calditrichota bacterium]
MNCIQKILMTGLKLCFNCITGFSILFLCFISTITAQQSIEFTEVELIDSLIYARISAADIHDSKYPPEKAFDADLKTCWVYASGKSGRRPAIYLRFDEKKTNVLNIFSGFGKNNKLFLENARPKKLSVSLMFGINPEGYVSEIGAIYKVVEFPQKKTVMLIDSFGVQSIPLDFSMEEIADFRKTVHQYYMAHMKPASADSCMLLKITVLETYPGTKYDDICISEIFYNDRFISYPAAGSGNIEKIYLNDKENILLVDETDKKRLTVYSDSSSVLQIIEISDDNKWAILISMPAEIEGRVETIYLLTDLVNKRIVNTQLEQYTGNYISGNDMHFSSGDNGRIYLIYTGSDFEDHSIELK